MTATAFALAPSDGRVPDDALTDHGGGFALLARNSAGSKKAHSPA
ncbi:hypothetical protein [Streptomyces sp. SD15]